MKIDRQAVYAKYDGHCAYCGKEITIKEMEVDHVIPQRYHGTDDMDNLMPSCHTCNHYKRANSLENFRDWLLGELIDRLMKVYIFRVALRYDMITINGGTRSSTLRKERRNE